MISLFQQVFFIRKLEHVPRGKKANLGSIFFPSFRSHWKINSELSQQVESSFVSPIFFISLNHRNLKSNWAKVIRPQSKRPVETFDEFALGISTNTV